MAKYTQYVCARAFRLKLRFGVRNLLLFLTARKTSHGSGGLIVSALPAKSSIFTSIGFSLIQQNQPPVCHCEHSDAREACDIPYLV